MTAKEAINELIKPACCDEKSIQDFYNDERKMAMEIEALERDMPQKPIRKTIEPRAFVYRCPNCNAILITKIANNFIPLAKSAYCPDCGQKLDWHNIK